ncbi:MAG TPA: chromosome partition protein MukE, partial [Polyangiaceae bacterium]|nr:chromosome partition protein MukE [Polyangiaceae bacterium]
RRYDERVAEENVRLKVAEALRRLAALGFVEMVEDAQIRLRPALMRFAEPVRGVAAPEVALERLVAEGELAFSDVDEESEPEQEPEPERAVDQASADALANLWDGFEEPGAATHSTDEPPEPE